MTRVARSRITLKKQHANETDNCYLPATAMM
ncbi:MAG: hypothetical protein QOD13_423 [Thermoleophilaceae bacterium]|nr:hypothetical protein [Thermoleophilaceae bacterium]